MLGKLHITIPYGEISSDKETAYALLEKLRQRDGQWGLFKDLGGFYYRLEPSKEFSWTTEGPSGALPQGHPPLLLFRWYGLTIIGELASSEPPFTSIREEPARERIEEWVRYARKKVADDLPDASEWNVSQIACRCLVSFKRTTLRDLGRVLLSKYKTTVDPDAKRVSWRCGSVEFGFTELWDGEEGLLALFEVFLSSSGSVSDAVERLRRGRSVGELVRADVVLKMADYYLWGKVYANLPIVPSDLEVFRRRLGPGKWDRGFGFASLMQNHAYSPAVLARKGYYGSADTVGRRRKDLEEVGLWRRPSIQPLSVLPQELLEAHPELGSLLPGVEVVWGEPGEC